VASFALAFSSAANKYPAPISGNHCVRRRRTQDCQRKGGVLGLLWRPKSILLYFSRSNGDGGVIVHKAKRKRRLIASVSRIDFAPPNRG
jgi:hypothetical protein